MCIRDRHCDLAAEVESTGLGTPEDYLAVYDSTMARFWFFSDDARKKITERLRGCLLYTSRCV